MAAGPASRIRIESEAALRPEALLQAPLRVIEPGPLPSWGFDPALWESPERLNLLVLASRLFADQKERIAFFQSVVTQGGVDAARVVLRRADGSLVHALASGRVVAEGSLWAIRVTFDVPEAEGVEPPSVRASTARNTTPKPSPSESTNEVLARLLDQLAIPEVGRSAERLVRFVNWVVPRRSALVIAGPEGSGGEFLVDALHDARGLGAMTARLDGEFDGVAALRGVLSGVFGRTRDRAGPGVFVARAHLASKAAADVLIALARAASEGDPGPPLYFTSDAGELADGLVEAGADRFDLAPLRERSQDILPALSRMLRRPRVGLRLFQTIHPSAAHVLQSHDWPGNVEEMREFVEAARLISGGPELRVEDLPLGLLGRVQGRTGAPATRRVLPAAAHGKRGRPRKELTADQIRDVLAETGGNRAEAARRLHVSRTTLWRKLAEYGEELFPPEPPEGGRPRRTGPSGRDPRT